MTADAITDAEVLAFIARTDSFYPADTVLMPLAEQRAIYDRMAAAFRVPRPSGIAVTDDSISGPAGPIPVRRYAPQTPSATLVYYHGGGFVVGGLDSHDDVCAEIALAAQVAVVSVEYRLCPEHPHPAAFDDALAALEHFADARPIVAGDSAGACLAAAVTLARPRAVRASVLIYPGLGGHLMGLPSYAQRGESPMLTTRDVRAYGKLRAGGAPPTDDPTFAPLTAPSFAGLPPSFVSAAEHDPLRDDGPEWARRIAASGGRATAFTEPELPHGHLRARHSSARAAEAFATICKAIETLAR